MFPTFTDAIHKRINFTKVVISFFSKDLLIDGALGVLHQSPLFLEIAA